MNLEARTLPREVLVDPGLNTGVKLSDQDFGLTLFRGLGGGLGKGTVFVGSNAIRTAEQSRQRGLAVRLVEVHAVLCERCGRRKFGEGELLEATL